MPSLSEADQKGILALARQAVVEAVAQNRRFIQIPTSGIFALKRGFNPMRPADLASLEIEVSLLSPLEAIRPEEVEIGKHGLFIEQSFYRGLLLPQVAVEHHLDRERFLRETCYKAGLPGDAWKAPETRLYGFTCEVFADPGFHDPK